MKFCLLLMLLCGCDLGQQSNNSGTKTNENKDLDSNSDLKNNKGKKHKSGKENLGDNNKPKVEKNFIDSLKTLASEKIDREVSSYIYKQFDGIIEPDAKINKMKEIIFSDIITNIYQNDPTKIKAFYEKCKLTVGIKNEENFKQLFKDSLSKDENIKIFLNKDYATVLKNLPEYLQEDNELQQKYIDQIIKNNKLSETIENNLMAENSNKLLYNIYNHNKAKSELYRYLSVDYLDKLSKEGLLKIAKNLGYQEHKEITNEALFETIYATKLIKTPYIEHRYDLYKLLDKDNIIFQKYDKILGKSYNYDNYLDEVLKRSTDKNKDIKFLLDNAKSLTEQDKTKLTNMLNN